jgi:pimeloyl-ACP methyl ester carboxylesterase
MVVKQIPQIIYVHGFGGSDHAPPFYLALNKFFKSQNLCFDLRTFAWDSLPTTPQTLIANFLNSQKAAEEAGRALHVFLTELESKAIDYHVIGFSLGASVIRHALTHQRSVLTHLRSIFLLGAAFNHNEAIVTAGIPAHARCHNYYSPKNDLTLRTSYYNVTGIKAAGTSGLSQATRFTNLATQCSHSMLYDYTILAEALGFLIAWDDQQYVPGSTRFNMQMSTMGGDNYWNNICYHHELLIQQNINTQHYRAIESSGKHRRIAWGDNLHAILRSL